MPWKDKSKYETKEYRQYMRDYKRAWYQKHKLQETTEVLEKVKSQKIIKAREEIKDIVISRPMPKEKGIKGAIGAESEAVIAAALIQAGYTVLTPNGYMHRYDLVIEDAHGEFWKIQCKTAWLTNGGDTINFSTASLLQAGQRGRKVSIRKTYKNDVHYFAVYSPDTRKVYLIPIECTPNTSMCLRLTDKAKNNQTKRIRYAVDYEL
jgi:hypothetical protein